MQKKHVAGLLLSSLSALVIIIDQGNQWNEWLYAFFYTGILLIPFGLVADKDLPGKTRASRLAMGIVLFGSLLLRIYQFPFLSADFTKNFVLWMEDIEQHGGLRALKEPFYDYSPPFMYILVFITKIPLSKLVAIKVASLFFEYLAAYFVYGIVKQFRSISVAFFAATVFLFLPTVVMNGSLWGQCDSIYTCFLLGCVYFLLLEKPTWSLVFFALSFAFKLQSVFMVLPLILAWQKKQIHLKHLLIVPLLYVVAIIPVALVGRPFADLLTIYIGQAGSTAGLLTANAPSLYALFPEADPALFSKLGVVFTGLLVLVFAGLYMFKKQVVYHKDLFLYTCALSVLVIPYFLPRMHERYFYPADVMLLLLAFRWPRLWFAPVVCGLASLLSYFPFLFDRLPVPFVYLSSALLLLVVFLTLDYLKRFFTSKVYG